jgi:hypothetical protein
MNINSLMKVSVMRSTNEPKDPSPSRYGIFSFFCSYLFPSAPKNKKQYPDCSFNKNEKTADHYECVRQQLNQDAQKAYDDLINSSQPVTVYRRN